MSSIDRSYDHTVPTVGMVERRKTAGNEIELFSLATLIIILLIISIATTMTLLVIIYRLRLIPGFEYFTIINDDVILHKDTYIDRLLLGKNRISRLSAIKGNIELNSGKTSLRINSEGIWMRARYGLEIWSASTGKLLFPFNISTSILNNIKTLSVPNGIRDVKLIRSPIDEDLHIQSQEKIRIRGNKGVRLEGKRIVIDAENLFLSSLNSSIILDGYKGIYLDMDSFKDRIIHAKKDHHLSRGNHHHHHHHQQHQHRYKEQHYKNASSFTQETNLQYKLCICAKNGRLFRIAIKDSSSSCADARFPKSDNPCL